MLTYLTQRLVKSSERLRQGLDTILTKSEPTNQRISAQKRVLDDALVQDLEDWLISCDMGVECAHKIVARLTETRFGQKVLLHTLKNHLYHDIHAILDPVARPLLLQHSGVQVILVVGVNGSGKTTTIGKLANQFKASGKHVMIVAGDTYRAAAVEQLKIWGARAQVPVITAHNKQDTASLAFDAVKQAHDGAYDIVLIDTAGRLHNRDDLMAELSKIVRVIKKHNADAPHHTLLVLDATTGQNVIAQVDTFCNVINVSGLIMAKLDGTARGGILVAVAEKFGLPLHAIGVGEGIDDLLPFDPAEFTQALLNGLNHED